jgi:hypothetical protein
MYRSRIPPFRSDTPQSSVMAVPVLGVKLRQVVLPGVPERRIALADVLNTNRASDPSLVDIT